MPLDYFSLIHKHIPPSSTAYRFYLPHVTLVTHKALAIGRQLHLSPEQLTFIEEAAMLHDIGIIKVNAPDIGCTGSLDYICHGTEGRTMLEQEELPQHALVCERHTGVGLSLEDIKIQNLPIPEREMLPLSIEEKVICWADLFYSKSPHKIWIEKTLDEARAVIAPYGASTIERFSALQRELKQ